MALPHAVVVGLQGVELEPQEQRLLAAANPLGVILFQRNVADPAQLRRLAADVRDCLGRDDAPILIDQEGGRVARLRPPLWRGYPPARRIGEIAERDPERGERLAYAVALRIAADLAAVGIDWVCAPVLDLLRPETHAVIGDRAFAGDPDLVARLGTAAVQGFLDGGVVPIVKHLPGHGRATADSHLTLPRVVASQAELEATDFVPFRLLADAPAAMTAHVCFEAIDPHRPFTTSATALDTVARGSLGTTGLLFSDDVDMQALHGSVAERVIAVLDAGHDVALQCSGRPEDMAAAVAVAPEMTAPSWTRFTTARARATSAALGDVDVAALDDELAVAGV
ncbi:MAG: beta-N-acetylhexosaminidase [Geminicoccaceae bacterium]|nr:MAG: beta-N-acetylhexosaminidase [Geminicoccaceae bacterium]